MMNVQTVKRGMISHRMKKEATTFVIACQGQYIRAPYLFEGSIYLTKNFMDAVHFKSKDQAINFLGQLYNTKSYQYNLIEPCITPNKLAVIKVIYQIVQEEKVSHFKPKVLPFRL
ncbi:hypothetical protein [Peribacillus sp. SCS-155]|uniref:hypothetical protein n=1 Tax=Peribacillus sedimenti TaxID=3115297 RepID=UPI0039058BCF